MPLLIRADFTGIGDIANHCDLNKLNIAINEAEEFDMEDIFCDFWQDVIDNWESEEENWDALINGGTYEGCNGRTRKFAGLKRVWAYYSYARYIMLNGYNDTANGLVSKTNNYSLPTPLKELETVSNKYREMAKVTLERTKGYLCKNATDFPNFNTYDCDSNCGCGGGCGNSENNTKGFGLSSTVITKKI